MRSMEFVADREIRNEPGKVRKRLSEKGELVVTARGKPYAIMIHVEPERVGDVLALTSEIRARMAVSNMRERAARKGLDKTAMRDIDREIAFARKERKQKSGR